MTNDETPKLERMTNCEARWLRRCAAIWDRRNRPIRIRLRKSGPKEFSSFGFRASFGFGCFVIRHCARLRARCLVAACVVFALATSVYADTVYVTTNGVGDGTGWGAAASLANGLTVCQDGDQLWVEGGTYDGTTFNITSNSITLYGGFTNGMSVLGERNWTNWPVILHGQNARRVVEITSSNVTFDGVTIRNGILNHPNNGAGFMKTSGGGRLTLANCTVYNNGGGNGHGAYVNSGSLLLSNTAFSGNYPSGYSLDKAGGGLCAVGVDVCIVDCLFSNNSVNGRGYGGGFYISGGSLAVTGTVFVGNTASKSSNGDDGGGAGFIAGLSARFVNCIFRDNESQSGGSGGYGGALNIHGSASTTVTVENCTIVDCYAVTKGGAFYVDSGCLALKNTILKGNTANAGDTVYNAGDEYTTIDYCGLDGTGFDQMQGNLSLSDVLTNNPVFAVDYSDLHLQSASGRWDTAISGWTNDAVHSPCIDAGDPMSVYSGEPGYNGSRVNMGAHGNTLQASKTPAAIAPVVTNRSPTVLGNVATLRGELIAGSQTDITFWYGTNQSALNLTVHLAFLQSTGIVFSTTLGNLVANTQYWYTCFATNGAGTNWASLHTNFLTTTPPGGGANIIHVDKDAPSPVETGLDWYNAYKTVSAGIAAAGGSTTTVWIAEGTYAESMFDLATNVTVYGGFTNGMTALAQRDHASHVVLLDGSQSHRVVDVTSSNVVLDGLTIKNGSLEHPNNGAGLQKISGGGTLGLFNCTFYNNGGGNGHGAYFSSGTVLMTNCIFSGNKSSGYSLDKSGGAFCAGGVDVSVVDCVFTNNRVGSRGMGGGFRITGGSLTVTGSLFVANYTGNSTATDNGGGAGFIDGASARFVNCIFRNNDSPSPVNTGYGGTFNIQGGVATTVTVVNCDVVDSYAGTKGGAFYVGSGYLVLSNTILKGCTASSGKTIYNAGDQYSVVEYCRLDGTELAYVQGNVTMSNVMTNDPLFVSEYGDLHLKSLTGRWDSVEGIWTNDAVHSPCIDAGGSANDYSNEPEDNGDRMNMGAYGNTAEASKSPATSAPMVTNRAPSVLANVATLKGELLAGGPTDITFWYGTNEAVLNVSEHMGFLQITGTVFSVVVGNLATNDQYWYSCFASNAAGTNWANPATSFWTTVPLSGGADIIHVDKDAPSPVQTGLDWCNAFKTVGAGIAAVDGATDTIWIAEGTYAESMLVLGTNMTVYGGFTNGMTMLGQRDHTDYPAVLHGGDARRVVDITSSNVILDGLTVRNGRLEHPNNGAGIQKASGGGLLTLLNCGIVYNGGGNGQGAYFGSGPVLMTNCTFRSNYPNGYSYDKWGGGFYAGGVAVSMLDCLFTNNSLGQRTLGGAFALNGGSLAATGCTFVANTTTRSIDGGDGGGAGYIISASARFMNCIFRDNECQAGTGGGYGAALNIHGDGSTTVTVENCTIVDCYAATRGGSFYVDSGNVAVKNTILKGNTAGSQGNISYNAGGQYVNIDYSCLDGTNGDYLVGNFTLSDVITNNPMFVAEYTNLHLKSKFGRWLGTDTWTNDTVTSPCIDAGDPDSVYANEMEPHGGQINLGAYGNTVQASKSPPTAGTLFMIR